MAQVFRWIYLSAFVLAQSCCSCARTFYGRDGLPSWLWDSALALLIWLSRSKLRERRGTRAQALPLDEVQFTVFRPKIVRPGEWYPMLAFAHLAERRLDSPAGAPSPIEEVRAQAEKLLGSRVEDFRESSVDARQSVPREAEIRLVPEATGIEFNPSERSFRWMKDLHREEFDLRASPTLDGTVARGRLSVYFGVILLAEVDFAFKVDSSQPIEASSELHEQTTVRPYDKVFPSYSHQDTQIVEQVEALVESLGIRYLRDVSNPQERGELGRALVRTHRRGGCVPTVLVLELHALAKRPARVGIRLDAGSSKLHPADLLGGSAARIAGSQPPAPNIAGATFQSDSGWSCPKRTACSRRDLDHRSASPEPGTRSQPA